MTTSLARSFAVFALAALVAPHRAPAAPRPAPATSCARALAAGIRRETSTRIPAACWQVGPIRLGMTEAELGRELGQPVARLAGTTEVAALYAFPSRAGPLVKAGEARFRMAELRSAQGRLIAIDDHPGATATSGRCPALDKVALDAAAGPLLRFADVRVGGSLRNLRRRFGRAPAANRSRDWYNYFPVPLTIDADGDRIEGFTIATDPAASTAGWPEPYLHMIRDPGDCRLTKIDFALR